MYTDDLTPPDGSPAGQTADQFHIHTDTRWAAKGEDLYWNGYKVHLSETCHIPGTAGPDTAHTRDDADTGQRDAPTRLAPDELPNLITNVATTDATVPDAAMTEPIDRMLDRRSRLPGQHYLDSGYSSAKLMTRSRTEHGIELAYPCWVTSHRRPGPTPGLTAPASPSISTASRSPARKDIPAPPGTRSPNAALTPL
ncbi:MAG: hypothetical protein ACRDRG_14295 [Pseudonocardiaceae bacterium]